MTVIEHIAELRKRIIYVLITLVVGLVAGLVAADPLYQFVISRPPADTIEYHGFSLWDGIGIYMKFAFVIALSMSLPMAMYHIWAFVSPGLRPIERKATIKYIPYVFLLFLAGVAFAYFIVFPMAFAFTSNINQHLGLVETYGITQVMAFMFNIILPLGLLFELPLVVMFLTAIRILNPLRLRKMRRYAYFGLVLIGVTISPPDLISDFLVSIPLLVLYEVSIMLSSFVYRKQLKRQQEWENEFDKGMESVS